MTNRTDTLSFVTTDVDATWLLGQRRLLRRHVSSAVHPDGGFAWLGSDNRPRLDRPVELWISARMTYVAALSVLEGDDTLQDPLAHGVTALDTVFRDPDHEGWFAAVSHGRPTTADKRAYEHAFVVLASAGAAAAGAPGGPALLDEALTTFETRFWRDTDGLVVDVWDRTWSTLEPYRGVNANMHTVEALLTASDVTGEARWARYAVRIVERVVHDFAAGNDYRLPEHFTSDWVALPDYNRDEPAHPFRPYGVTIGHLPATPARLLDSRPGGPTADGQLSGIGQRPVGSVLELPVVNRAGVPAATATVVLNVTVTGAAGPGYVTVYPCGQPVPLASNLNFVAGQTVPNAVVATVGTGGKVCIFTSAATHLIADVFGTLQ